MLVHQLSSVAPHSLFQYYSLFIIPGSYPEFAHGPYTYWKDSYDQLTAFCCWLPPPGLRTMLNNKQASTMDNEAEYMG